MPGLLGLKHDLQWLCHLEPTGVPPVAPLSLAPDARHMDLTEIIDFWQSRAPFWKACVKRARKACSTGIHDGLYQHLAYVSRRANFNSCYQALRQRGFQGLPEQTAGAFQALPITVRGLGRVEALQAAGPLQPLPVVYQSEHAQLQTQLHELRKGLEPSRCPMDPEATKE